jgi:hypothetical protein
MRCSMRRELSVLVLGVVVAGCANAGASVPSPSDDSDSADDTPLSETPDSFRCTPGDIRCDGDKLQVCNSKGGNDDLETCPPGLCNAVSKVCDDCKPGSKDCLANTPRVCGANGQWTSLSDCPVKTACIDGSCTILPPGTWSASFTKGAASTVQCKSWSEFRMTLNGTYTKVTIKGSRDPIGVTCSGTNANALCRQMNTPEIDCDGRKWVAGFAHGGFLASGEEAVGCTDPGYTVRPCITVAGQWGGVAGPTCDAESQTLTVSCE